MAACHFPPVASRASDATPNVYFATPVFMGGGAARAGSNNHNRLNLTLYESADGGLSWSTVRVVYAGLGAYSDMVWLPERGGIGVLFERGQEGAHGMEYVAVSFAVVPVTGQASHPPPSTRTLK